MWNKIERFVLVIGIYEYLLEPTHITESGINWDFIANNCLYKNEEYSLDSIQRRFSVFTQNLDYYNKKIDVYLENTSKTPHIVIATLIAFFMEVDETLAINDDLIKDNFLGKYPRLTQELIAGEYTSLVNAIVRKVASDLGLNFVSDSSSEKVH
ncbi:MAG: hypothetical protein ACRCXZ_03830 [Patescibacteria group bacterium]